MSGFRRPAVLVALAGPLAAASGIGLLATSGWLITTASTRPPVLALAVAIGAVQAFALGRGVARYIERLGVHALALDRLGRLRLALFDDLQCRVPGTSDIDSTAVLLGLVSDTETVTDGWAKLATGLVDTASTVVLGAGLAALVCPPVGVRLLAGSVAVVAAGLVAARSGRRAFAREAVVRSDLARAVVETVSAAREMAVYGREEMTESRLADVRRRSVAAARQRATVAAGGMAVTVMLSALSLVVLLDAGVAAVHVGHLRGVMLSVVVFTALAVLDQCAAVPAVLLGREERAEVQRRLSALRHLPVPAVDPPPAAAGGVPSAQPAGADGGGVVYEGVCVEVGGHRLLDGLTLGVAPGERVAVIGPNGAGKSTLAHALLHFVDCTRGSVRVGGSDVRALSREQLASEVGWVNDEAYLFAGTVRGNLRLAAPGAGDADMRRALERAGLSDWLAALPEGLDTVIGAGGRPVSAGERQRIGVARGLMANPRVLVLDEPTAHVDPSSAAPLMDDLLGAAGDRSVLLISHDVDPPGRVDRVVSISAGRVAKDVPGTKGPVQGSDPHLS